MALPGTIASGDIASANTDVLAWTATEPAIIAIRLANRNNAIIKVRSAIGTGGTPAAGDYLRYDSPLDANQPVEDHNITVSNGDKVWVRSDTAGVSYRVHGVPAT